MRIFLVLLTLTLSLFASDFGSISLVVLKDGIPLKNQSLTIVDTSKQTAAIKATTDEDGYFFVKVKEGNYQIRLLARDKGKAQAFVRKNVAVKAGEDSQVVVALKKNNALAFIDAEAPESGKVASKETKKAKQKGTVLLTLESSEDNKKVKGATIFVKGTNIEATSDAKGFVSLELPEGNQTISIIHQDFSAQTLKVKVVANETVSKSVSLSPAAMELEEFVVLAPHIEGSVAASISEQKNSDAVGNVLGSEQFSKSGDSTVASALKRVSGITIVGGKYVYVRGLGDRYSTVMLNGLHIPSPEPTKRVVPLDIFPTSVVQSITIQKSYTGDIPASFGGGTVLIKSKDIPKDNDGYVKLGLELLANDATGKSVTTNGTNSRPLPNSVLPGGNNVGGDQSITNDVRTYRRLNPEKSTLKPGMKLELSLGKSYAISDEISVGASGMLYYKNSSDSNQVDYNKYFYDNNSKSLIHDNNTKTDVSNLNNEISAMINIGVNYYDNKIKYTYFTTDQTKDSTLVSSIDYTGETDDREKTYYEYVEKKLTSQQLSGTNNIKFSNHTDGYFDNLVIDWAGESSKATRDEPGTVEVNYLHQTSGLNWYRKNWYYYFLLNDNVNNYRADFSLPFKFNDNDNYTKAGVFIYNKSRDFDSRRFKMLSDNFDDMQEDMDTIYNKYADSLDFSASYKETDSYKATQDATAFYLKQLLSVTHDFDIIASVRQESSSQQLTDTVAHTPLKTSDLFPTLGLTYRFDNDDMQLRFAYAQSISRPDFREFSNSRYKDPITENIVFGNPELKATYISHFDLKYEWYLSSDEIFSVALFSKEFTNPIEKVIKLDDSQDNIFQETYQNADSATSYGVEVDYRKRFGFIDESLDNLLFATNVALIESTIKLNSDPDNEFTSRLTSKKRPMQGQSPYVANFTFGYDNTDSGNSALFLFNQIGKRIVSLGTDKNKDIYQQPFAKLDFVTKYKISPKKDGDLFGYSLKFKAENLLNSEMKFTQGDLTTASTKPGRYYSLKLDIKY